MAFPHLEEAAGECERIIAESLGSSFHEYSSYGKQQAIFAALNLLSNTENCCELPFQELLFNYWDEVLDENDPLPHGDAVEHGSAAMVAGTRTVCEYLPVAIEVARAEGSKELIMDGRRYRREEILGKGSYGYVFRVVDVVTGEAFAVKKQSRKGGYGESALREIDFMRQFEGCPYLCQIAGAAKGNRHIYTRMELIDGVSMPNYLEGKADGRLSKDELALLAPQLGAAVRFLTKKGIECPDLKPANMIVSADGKRLWVCDFGLGIQRATGIGVGDLGGGLNQSMVAGSSAYVCPEFFDKRYGISQFGWQGEDGQCCIAEQMVDVCCVAINRLSQCGRAVGNSR